MDELNEKIKTCRELITVLDNCKNIKGVYEHDLVSEKLGEAIKLLYSDLGRMESILCNPVRPENAFKTPTLFEK